MKKKLFCILLCGVMLVASLCGCGQNANGEKQNTDSKSSKSEGQTGKTVTMLYNRSDTLDPYMAKSDLNRNLALLLYDPLIRLDNNFKVDNCLALQTAFDGRVCTVTLRDVAFSDGSAVSAKDVLYSYEIAKKQAKYSQQFEWVQAVYESGDKMVVFELKRNDPYFVNLLDFPILKAESSGRTDDDGVPVAPVGCGRYVFDKENERLNANASYYKGALEIPVINLLHAPDEASASHYVEIGAASLYYTDISSGGIIRMSGKKTDVNLNALVFIGINDKNELLKSKNMRYAISSAINRADICKNAYFNNAVAAVGFFNPAFEDALPVQTIDSKNNLEITVENLGKIGYNKLNSDGYCENADGSVPAFSLLVNRENDSRVQAARLIAGELKAAGIKITVVEKPFNEYLEDIKNGSFDLYLGEINISSNMDMSPLTVSGGKASFGISAKGESEPENETPQEGPAPNAVTEAAVASFYSGESSVLNLAGTLLTEMPQIPVCYRKGILFYSDAISGEVEASLSDIYYSVNSYIVK